MSNSMTPDFSGFKLDLSGDEDITNVGGATGFRSMKPGTHTVKIKTAEWKGAPDKDPTWNKLRVAYEAADGSEVSEYLLIPTKSTKYGPSGTIVPFQKLVETMKAIGFEVDSKNAGDILAKVFRNIENLIGMQLTIRVGYKGAYINYVTKGQMDLLDAKTNEKLDSFSSRDEAESYCTEAGILFSKYPEVFGRSVPPAKNNLSKFTVSAVKKLALG